MTNLIGMALVVLSIETNITGTGLCETWMTCSPSNTFTMHTRQRTVTNVYYRIGTTNGVEVLRVAVKEDTR